MSLIWAIKTKKKKQKFVTNINVQIIVNLNNKY